MTSRTGWARAMRDRACTAESAAIARTSIRCSSDDRAAEFPRDLILASAPEDSMPEHTRDITAGRKFMWERYGWIGDAARGVEASGKKKLFFRGT